MTEPCDKASLNTLCAGYVQAIVHLRQPVVAVEKGLHSQTSCNVFIFLTNTNLNVLIVTCIHSDDSEAFHLLYLIKQTVVECANRGGHIQHSWPHYTLFRLWC